MKAVKRTICVGLAIVLAGLLASSTAWAVVTPVFSLEGDRTVLNVTDDTVVWDRPDLESVLSGASFLSQDGLGVQVFRHHSPALSGIFACEDGSPSCDFEIETQHLSWVGNFNEGDRVLDNLTFTPFFSDAIHVQFSVPVSGAGAQLGLNSLGDFFGRVRVYSTPFDDASDDSDFLGEALVKPGNSCDSKVNPDTEECPKAIFMGFFSDIAEIRRIEFNVFTDEALTAEARFGINQVDIGTVASVPEPGTFLLLTTGVLALAYGRRRFSR